jgi:class 3 adenylate cyclase
MTASEHQSATFVFADIPGYTALAEAHGDANVRRARRHAQRRNLRQRAPAAAR